MSSLSDQQASVDCIRMATNERNSTISDEDAELIVQMLAPKEVSNLDEKTRVAVEARLVFALKYIRNATGESYAVDFVLNPKIMSALNSIILADEFNADKFEIIMDIFINTSSRSQPLSQLLIEKHNFIELLDKLSAKTEDKKTKIIWLLSNLAGMCPELVHERLAAINSDYLSNFIDLFASGKDGDLSAYYGQVAVSLSTIDKIRQIVVDEHLDKFLPLCGRMNPIPQSRVTALSLLRNLAVDTQLHPTLLAKPEYLTAVLEPIMSDEYEFSDEEIEKLPTSLQYFDGKPILDDNAETMIIEALYKLCDSRLGRETLREKSVYPILREFHKVQKRLQLDDTLGAGSSAMGIVGPNGPVMQMLDPDNPLEAVIGILIRSEDDIGLPSEMNYGDIEMDEQN